MVSEWIAVEDALPDEAQGWVLVALPLDEYESVPKIRLGYYSEERRRFVSQSGQSIEATHWMPMPPPPGGQR